METYDINCLPRTLSRMCFSLSILIGLCEIRVWSVNWKTGYMYFSELTRGVKYFRFVVVSVMPGDGRDHAERWEKVPVPHRWFPSQRGQPSGVEHRHGWQSRCQICALLWLRQWGTSWKLQSVLFLNTQRTELTPSVPFYAECMISDFFCPQVCIHRCLERGKSSERTDDNRESLEKRYSPAAQTKWLWASTVLNPEFYVVLLPLIDFMYWFHLSVRQAHLICIDLSDPFSWLLDACMCVFSDLICVSFESPGSSDPNNQACFSLMQNSNLPAVYKTNC